MRIIVPKVYVPREQYEFSTLYFLAGPIRGGGDWQAQMCLEIGRVDADAYIACPCRWDPNHRLAEHFLPGSTDRFDRQLDWEQYYLTHAGLSRTTWDGPGCIIFWLGLEDKARPHPGPEPYAMDTRGELGEWRMRMKYEGAKVVLGGHPDFYGLSQIQRNFSHAVGYSVPIYHTMAETVKAAVAAAR